MSGAIMRYVAGAVLLSSALLAVSAHSETILSVTQYGYDANARLACTAVRMNPASFTTLPSSACDLGASGSYGPDRITRIVYDNAGQVTEVRKAVGTPLQQTYVNIAYTPNGKTDWVEDANGNRSDYTYDGLDRQVQLNFPSTTLGAHVASVSDYEAYGYDINGNRIWVRLRSGETIYYGYDALNRETLKNLPGSSADVYSDYDAFGRRRYAHFGSASGQGVDYGYDGLGRLTNETSYGRTLSYQFDLANNRTRVTWPGGDFYVDYTYDAANRMKQVRENGATNGAGVLATYSYDNLGRRSSISRGNSTSAGFGYDGISRPSSLTHDLAGADNDQSFSFTYTPNSQIASRTLTNTAYAYTASPVSQSYARNGLNQYTSVAGVSFNYDLRGNLLSDGTRSFGYDLENRLTSVNGSSMSLVYDPLGRLRETTASSTTTTLLYDGDRLSAEYNNSGTLLRRYVHGSNGDEPLVWYEGSGITDRRYLIGDNQGSIIADSGSSTTRYAYGPYGEPSVWGGSRFRYTGQIALPEAQLYHYKARVYDPKLGRFLQTDPVGYEDDVNLYGYAHNDPLNRIDPTGEDSIVCNITNQILESCTLTPDDRDTTTVTYNQTNTWTDSDGKEHSDTTSTTATYEGSISQEGGLSRLFLGQGDGIRRDIEHSLSNMTGREVTLVESHQAPVVEAGATAWMRRLGNMGNRANERVEDVARARGANGSNIQELGHWRTKTMKELAQAAVNGDESAVTALKIVKDAARLSQKY